MMEELCPRQRIRYGISTIILNSLFHILGIGCTEIALSLGFVRKVNDDKPSRDGDNLSDEALDDL